MNLENFAEYLKYPSRLYQLPYEELKSLTLQYPYCASFHVLLLIKSKLEGHPDLEKNLARAATYSIDRSYLRQLMQEEQLLPVESQINIGEDEVLELKDLFSLDSELEKIPLSDENQVSEVPLSNSISFDHDPEDELSAPFIPPVIGENSDEEPELETPAEAFAEPELTPEVEVPLVPEDVADEEQMPDAATAELLPFFASEELILQAGTIINIAHLPGKTTKNEDKNEPAPAPSPAINTEDQIADWVAVSLSLDHFWEQQARREFTEWEWDIAPKAAEIEKPPSAPEKKTVAPSAAPPTPKSRFKSFRKRYHRPGTPEKAEEEPVPVSVEPPVASPKPKEVAAESLRVDLGVASETLAGLLVQQHQYDRAIQMYEHLSLLIPEKNAYFAAKIDEIKNI